MKQSILSLFYKVRNQSCSHLKHYLSRRPENGSRVRFCYQLFSRKIGKRVKSEHSDSFDMFFFSFQMILNLNVLNSLIYNDMTMSVHVCAHVQSHTHTAYTQGHKSKRSTSI